MMMKGYLSYLCIALLVGCGRDAPPRITVDVSPTGQMSLEGHQVTAEALAKHCKLFRERHGLGPVIIRGADDTRHADIRTAMDSVTIAGLGDIAYATAAYETRTFPRYMNSLEPKEGTSPYGPSPEGTLYLVVSPDGYNAKSLTTSPPDTKVAVFCTPDSRQGDLIDVLKQCEAMGIAAVYVGTVSKKETAEQGGGEERR